MIGDIDPFADIWSWWAGLRGSGWREVLLQRTRWGIEREEADGEDTFSSGSRVVCADSELLTEVTAFSEIDYLSASA